MLAASVAGASHAARDEPCQDAHAAALLPGGALAVAVADGAGSAPQGALGAALAAAAVVDALGGDEVRGGDAAARLRAAAGAARAALVVAADARGAPLRDLACTLTVALVEPERAAVLQVGDGLALLRVAKDYADGPVLAVAPTRGEHANETTFLTADDALDRPCIVVLAVPVDGLALSTDGLLRLAIDLRAAAPYPAFVDPLLAFAARATDGAAAALAAFLAGPRVRSRTDDDVTLTLAVRSA